MSEAATLPKYVETPPPGAGDLYEVVNGQVVEPREMGALETWLSTALTGQIYYYFARRGEIGTLSGETLFLLDPEAGLQRRPDLAFISYDRWPRDRPAPPRAAWNVIPDLTIEIVSPNDLAVEVVAKVNEYFRAGVRQVWVIYPRQRTALVHVSPRLAHVLGEDDHIDGGDVLPGFRLRLGDLLGGTAGAQTGD